jgi:hypothetical protein
MKQLYSLRLLLTIASISAGSAGEGALLAESSDVAGTWRGESVCAAKNSACRDESVTYYIRDIPGRLDTVVIQADKNVGGNAITMGTREWAYDRTRRTLEWRTPQQVWVLHVTDSRIEGTLTLADKTVFRTMTLEREKQENQTRAITPERRDRT